VVLLAASLPTLALSPPGRLDAAADPQERQHRYRRERLVALALLRELLRARLPLLRLVGEKV
jgi:hypothetical protein